MGYYTGNGEVTAIGESESSLKNFYWYGGHVIQQKCVRTTRRIAGVSKATAESYHSSRVMSAVGGGSGSLAWIVYDAEGTDIQYESRPIDGSNLYEVTESKSVYTAWHGNQNVRHLG